MTGDLRIRRYRPDDRERVRTVTESALRDVNAFFGGEGLDEDFRALEAATLDGPGEFLVGTVDGQVVATGAFRPPAGVVADRLDDLGDGTAELERMHVLPDHQRGGYGGRILDALERRATNRDREAFVLVTTDRQEAACAFYEAAGFELLYADAVEAFGEAFEAQYYRKELR